MEKKYDRKENIYSEGFDNYKEFLNAIERRQPEASRKLEEATGTNWKRIGVNSVREAKDLLINGWDKPVERINRKFENATARTIERSQRRPYANVQGFAPIVPNALMGLPNSMIDYKTQPKKTKIIEFYVVIDRAWCVDADEIEDKMVKQLADIAELEKQGFRCRISVVFTAYGGKSTDEQCGLVCSVKVKDESQPFDIKRLTFPIVNPAMLRCLMFGWEGTLNARDSLNRPYDRYHWDGMGTAFEHWDSKDRDRLEKVLAHGNDKAIVLGLNDSVQDKMGKEVR